MRIDEYRDYKMTFREWLNGWAQYGRIRMIQNAYFPDRYGLDQHPCYLRSYICTRHSNDEVVGGTQAVGKADSQAE
jgi:hypothetical protein